MTKQMLDSLHTLKLLSFHTVEKRKIHSQIFKRYSTLTANVEAKTRKIPLIRTTVNNQPLSRTQTQPQTTSNKTTQHPLFIQNAHSTPRHLLKNKNHLLHKNESERAVIITFVIVFLNRSRQQTTIDYLSITINYTLTSHTIRPYRVRLIRNHLSVGINNLMI